MAIDAANLINSNVVYNTNNSLNTYNKAIQQQQLKAQAEQKALTEELSTVKSDGIREGDKTAYFNKFDDWSNSTIQAEKERDPQKRMLAQSDAEKKKLQLVQFVNDSKQFGKNENDFANKSLDNRFRVQFTDDAIQKAQQNRKLSITDPNYIKDYSTLGRQIDLSKTPDKIDKIRKTLLDASQFSNNTQDKITNMGGRTWVDRSQKRSVPIEQQATVIGRHYDAEPDLQAYYVKKYPQLYDSLPPEQAKAQAILTDLSQYAPLEEKKINGSYLPNEPKGSDGAPSSNPISVDIPYGQNGKYRVRLDNYVPVSIPNKNFAGSEFIDLKTGKTAGKLPSSSDYSIVGVSNAPFINKGSLKGSISQPNYAENNPNDIDLKPIIHVQKKATADSRAKDYFIPYDRLPENVKQSKQFRQATANFVPNQQQQQQQPQQSKSNSSSSKFDPVAYFNQVMKNKK